MRKTVVIVSIASMFSWCDVGSPSSVLGQGNQPKSNGDIEKWIADLRAADPFVRCRAAGDLRIWVNKSSDTTKVVPALIEALNDSEIDVVHLARATLAYIGLPAFKALRVALKDKRASVQRGAIETIGDIGSRCKPALPELMDFLKSEDLAVRAAAARAVFRVSGSAERSVPVLREALKDGTGEVREGAAKALGEMGPDASAALLDLKKRLKDDEGKVRVKAALAYYRVGGSADLAVPVLVEQLNDPYARYAAAEAVGYIGPDAKGAVDPLIELIRDEETAVLPAATALGYMGASARKAVPALIAAAQGKDFTLAYGAIEALRRLAPEVSEVAEAAPALAKLSAQDSEIALAAGHALQDLGAAAKPAVPILKEALASPNAKVAKNAALKKPGNPWPRGPSGVVGGRQAKGDAATRRDRT